MELIVALHGAEILGAALMLAGGVNMASLAASTETMTRWTVGILVSISLFFLGLSKLIGIIAFLIANGGRP